MRRFANIRVAMVGVGLCLIWSTAGQETRGQGAAAVPPVAGSTNAYHRLLAVVQQLATVATIPPAAGRCHTVAGRLDAADQKERPIVGDFRMVIGPGGKFMARVKSPQIGEFAVGQGQFPWVELPENKVPIVFAGTRNPLAGSNVLSYVDPQHKVKLQLVTGALATLTLAPDLVQRYAVAEFEGGDPAGGLTVTARDARKTPGGLSISFQKDGVTPKEVGFELGGVQGDLHLRGWQISASGADALFEPPEKVTRREVQQKELLTDIGALLNYAGDRIKLGKSPPAEAEVTFERLKPKEFLETYINQ